MSLSLASRKRALGLAERARQLQEQREGARKHAASLHNDARSAPWIATYFHGRKRRLARLLKLFALTPVDAPALSDTAGFTAVDFHGSELWSLAGTGVADLPSTDQTGSVELAARILCRTLMFNVETRLSKALAKADGQGVGFSARVMSSATGGLFRRLLALLAPTIILELNVYALRVQEKQTQECLRQFCLGLQLPEAQRSLWERYPVLWVQLAAIASNVAEAACETVERIAADYWDIVETFTIADAAGVEAIEWGIGDTHRRGHAVAMMTIGTVRIVYKPRSLRPEALYSDFAIWYTSVTSGPLIPTCLLLDKGHYGYVEHIAYAPCKSPAELEQFYVRVGTLIATAWLLGIADLHFENLVARGQYPFLVDLESILGRAVNTAGTRGQYASFFSQAFQDLLFNTCLLPMKIAGADGIYDVSAIGTRHVPPSIANVLMPEQGANGEIRLGKHTLTSTALNSPFGLNANDACAYQNYIVAGYTVAMDTFRKNSDFLRSFLDRHPRAEKIESRWVPRRTQDYFDVMQKWRHPSVLTDGLDRDLLATTLWHRDGGDEVLHCLLPSELADLAHGDVPYFHAEADSADLIDSRGKRFKGFFASTGIAAFKHRIDRLEEIQAPQESAIRVALLSTVIRAETDRPPEPPSIAGHSAVNSDALLQHADEIGDVILRRAMFVGAVPFWPGLRQLNDVDYGACVLPPTLYDGAVGIGVFCANLYRQTGNARLRRIVEGVHRLCGIVLAEPRTFMDCGAYSGIAGVIYGQMHLARALGSDPSKLTETAIRDMSRSLGRTASSDVVSGAAGAILGLLRYHHVSGSGAAVDVAMTAARRLVARAAKSTNGTSWPFAGHPNGIGGLAHGATGVAWALAEVRSISGDRTLDETIAGALAFEESLFDHGIGTWLDVRSGMPSCHWCHGATGIGLAAHKLHALRGDDVSADILRRAGSAVKAHGYIFGHCLCHGIFGNLELPLSMGDTAEARTMCAYALEVKAKRGRWICSPDADSENLGLMCGLAGIGYQLLRCANPGAVPNILCLDMPPA